MVSKDSTRTPGAPEDLPFGSVSESGEALKKRARRKSTTTSTRRRRTKSEEPGPESPGADPGPKRGRTKKAEADSGSPEGADADEAPKRQRAKREDSEPSNEQGGGEAEGRSSRRGRSRRRRGGKGTEAEEDRGRGRSRRNQPRGPEPDYAEDPEGPPLGREGRQRRSRRDRELGDDRPSESRGRSSRRAGRERENSRDRGGRGGRERTQRRSERSDRPARQEGAQASTEKRKAEATGMFVLGKGNIGVLRLEEDGYLPTKREIFVSKQLIQKWRLRDGMFVTGRVSRGQKHKQQLVDVSDIDGKPPKEWLRTTPFKNLTSIDPDFHYAVGDVTKDVSMRIMDILAPVGRGQRGLIVAPPRSGKTTLMRSFAKGIEEGFPDVHLMVVLVNERPEEATDWKRSLTRGQLYVSTADETDKNHIQVAEAAWFRAMRLVEMGEDVVMLLDSITRLARAYNNYSSSGRTMSGGLDSRAMERPRKLFGSARNTTEAGSLTILGTTLVYTGSRMDTAVFEEFKGTGNMELVLSRRLADRRIFPAIDLELSGTRKEEKLLGLKRLKWVHTLRRVLSRLHWAESMDTLITRLDDVEKTDDFLKRFEVDPEA
ncbi:MAG: transcription termination factor Rho [bacterium]|nr:transcription termination factor Rho [bacterium]